MGNCGGKRIQNFDPNQKYRKIRSACKRSNSLFEDEKFPASNVLLTGGTESTFSYFGQQWNCSEIKWLRPHEICQNLDGLEPKMVVGERDRFDINQGEVGDCWFLAPLASLAENQHYFEKVVPKGQEFDKNYCGVFRFRFYRFGEWHEVVIDDKLPTRYGKLIYLRAKEPNEFWSPLLEKAYAKFYGSYAAIEGGISMDAAVDFTGGIPKLIDIETDLEKIGSEKIFHLLKISYRNDAIITCSLGMRHRNEAQNNGLQSSHAYSITKVKNIKDPNSKGSIPLLRLRNPHGNEKEWKGDWSDGSEQWKVISRRVKRKLGLEFESDGEFYMCYNRDFLKYFGKVEIVNLNPIRMELNEAKMARKFNLYETYGQWQRGFTAGGTNNFEKNPQHYFTITNKRDRDTECSVVISLTQKLEQRHKEYSIGFRLYKFKKNEDQTEETLPPRFINNAINVTGDSGAYINLREVSKTFSLSEGSFCLVPSTFNSGEEAEYLIRIYVDSRWNCETDGRRFTVRDHSCCFTCCCPFGSRSTCCRSTPTSCYPSCCSSACCCQDDHFYENTKHNEDQHDEGKVRHINIELLENSGVEDFKDLYTWKDCAATEMHLLKRITSISETE